MDFHYHLLKNKENFIIKKLLKEVKNIILELLKKILVKKMLGKHIYLF